MSVMGAGTAGRSGHVSEPRVRELARGALALMAFSGAMSVSVALLILLAYGSGR